jgi:Sulfotransferase family
VFPSSCRIEPGGELSVKRLFGRRTPSRVIGRLREIRDAPAPRLSLGDHDREREPPIFVVGCFRSGTSMIRRILDSHSRIACPPESKFVLPVARILRDRHAIRGLVSMGFDRADVAAALADFVRGFFDEYAAAAGKPRWADKTPDYVECLPELWELFGPEARFVVIIRHGMDVAYSLSDPHRHYPAIDGQVARAGGDVAIGAARFWADQNEKIEAFMRDHPDASHLIRYEDVTVDPEPTVRRVFEFLGEAWEPDVLAYNEFRHHAGLEDPDVKRRRRIVPNSGRYRSWPVPVQEAVRQACQPVLGRLGYE